MIKFSILLLTYNRHKLLNLCLQSLRGQTHSNYEVFVVDNGSEPPVSLDFEDERFRLIRYKKNTNGCTVGESILDIISGDYFVFLADDDYFSQDTLYFVEDLILNCCNAEIIQAGLAYFDHDSSLVRLDKNNFQSFSGEIIKYNAKEAAYFFCCGWGIGPEKNYKAPPMSHSSGTFLSSKLIAKTRSNQRELFIRPFGDIGYVGALFYADYVYYLDLPLVIIGQTINREMQGSLPGKRNKWLPEIQYLEYTPLRSSSFPNMGADGHLKVLYRNKINLVYDCTLRPDFYFRHLRQVLSDRPFKFATFVDILICIPYYLKSIFHYYGILSSFKYICLNFILLLKYVTLRIIPNRKLKNKHVCSIDTMHFSSIVSFSNWLTEFINTKNSFANK